MVHSVPFRSRGPFKQNKWCAIMGRHGLGYNPESIHLKTTVGGSLILSEL